MGNQRAAQRTQEVGLCQVSDIVIRGKDCIVSWFTTEELGDELGFIVVEFHLNLDVELFLEGLQSLFIDAVGAGQEMEILAVVCMGR